MTDKIMNNGFKLIIFDLDGTLVDSSPDVIECFNYALNEEGLPPAAEQKIKATIGYPLKESLAEFGDPERLYSHFVRKAQLIMGNRTTLINGVKETLAELKDKGFFMAIATTKIRQNATRVIRKLEIADFIDELSCADDVKNIKPSPDPLLRLLDIFKLKPESALMVGDTINDIIAARRAGIKSAAITTGFDSEDILLKERPDWIIRNIAEVKTLVSNGGKSKNQTIIH